MKRVELWITKVTAVTSVLLLEAVEKPVTTKRYMDME